MKIFISFELIINEKGLKKINKNIPNKNLKTWVDIEANDN